MLPVYCLEHNLHVDKYTTFSEEHFRSGGLIKWVLCVVVDLKLSALKMCSQISHLDFLHGPQNPSFFRTGELSLLQEYLSNFSLFGNQ